MKAQNLILNMNQITRFIKNIQKILRKLLKYVLKENWSIYDRS
jgi:hypothetical protein